MWYFDVCLGGSVDLGIGLFEFFYWLVLCCCIGAVYFIGSWYVGMGLFEVRFFGWGWVGFFFFGGRYIFCVGWWMGF